MKVLRGRVNWDKFYDGIPHLELLLDVMPGWETYKDVPEPWIDCWAEVDESKHRRDHYFVNCKLSLSVVEEAMEAGLIGIGPGHETFHWEGQRKVVLRQSFEGGNLELVLTDDGRYEPAVELPNGALWTRPKKKD